MTTTSWNDAEAEDDNCRDDDNNNNNRKVYGLNENDVYMRRVEIIKQINK